MDNFLFLSDEWWTFSTLYQSIDGEAKSSSLNCSLLVLSNPLIKCIVWMCACWLDYRSGHVISPGQLVRWPQSSAEHMTTINLDLDLFSCLCCWIADKRTATFLWWRFGSICKVSQKAVVGGAWLVLQTQLNLPLSAHYKLLLLWRAKLNQKGTFCTFCEYVGIHEQYLLQAVVRLQLSPFEFLTYWVCWLYYIAVSWDWAAKSLWKCGHTLINNTN